MALRMFGLVDERHREVLHGDPRSTLGVDEQLVRADAGVARRVRTEETRQQPHLAAGGQQAHRDVVPAEPPAPRLLARRAEDGDLIAIRVAGSDVVRVGVAYLVVSWIVMQILDVIVEPLRLPDWTATLVLVLLVVGLPLALLFSWAFEMTPQGLKKTAEVDADASITPSTGRKLDRMIIGALVLAVVFLVYDRLSTAPPVTASFSPAPAATRRPR